MKFVLKVYADIRQQVETMSVRQLLRSVACPAATACSRSVAKDFGGVFVHAATKEQVAGFVEYVNDGKEEGTLLYPVCRRRCGHGDQHLRCYSIHK